MDYKCIECKYFTKKYNDWCRHLRTKKHLSENVYLCKCGKEFKHQSGLCRHKKNCEYYKIVNGKEICGKGWCYTK